MDRLTYEQDFNGYYSLKGMCRFNETGLKVAEQNCYEYCEEHDCPDCIIQKAIIRLAKYENTGLSPQDIEDLKKKSLPINKRGRRAR